MSLPEPKTHRLSRREEVYEAARKLVECGQDTQPGLASWNQSMESLYQNLVKLCKDDWT